MAEKIISLTNLSLYDELIKAKIATETAALSAEDAVLQSAIDALTSGDLSGLLDTAATSLSISMDSSTYVITVSLKNSSGTVISSGTVDLPMESTVVNGSYDNTSKQVTLTLTSGDSVSFSVADLIDGLVSTAELEAEAEARESADTTLQTNITAEETARTAADAAIQAQLDAMEYATSDDINALFE